jgi:hypothetical protein
MKKTLLTTAILSLFTVNAYAQTITSSEKQAIIQESVDEINILSHSDNVKNVTAQYGGNQVIAALNAAKVEPTTQVAGATITDSSGHGIRLTPGMTRKLQGILNIDVGAAAKGTYQDVMSTRVNGALLGTIALSGATGGKKLLKKELLVSVSSVATFEVLANNSDKIQDYFTNHPEQTQAFYDYLEKKKSEATTTAMYQHFVNLEQKLGIDAGFVDEVAQVEATSQYQAILADLEKRATVIDVSWVQTHPNQPQCSITDLEDIVYLSNKQYLGKHLLVDSLTFPNPYKTGSMPIYSVASFKQLKDNYKLNPGIIIQNQDHIPSYAAIRDYLKDKGINVTVYKREKDSNGNRLINDSNDARHANLNNNLTAFSVEDILHEKGRTYSGRNSSKQILNDKKNLRLATLKDMAFTAYYIENHPTLYKISANDYIKIGWTIYQRNKEMCLYDIPYTNLTQTIQ